jgi:cytochrome c oxidase subunit 3
LSNAHSSVLQHHFESLEQQKEASTLGMWAFLVQEVLFFGGLFTMYTIYRHQHFEIFQACSHHLDWKLGAFNTAVLICSSLTMALAVHGAALGHGKQAAAWLLLTIALGGVFLGVKVVEYKEKWEHHLIPGPSFGGASQVDIEETAEELHLAPSDLPRAQLYFSLYFAMTGLHALHMIIGMPIIAWLAWRASQGAYSPQYSTPVEMTGLYWHFVDIVWIFLFPLLYLIGHH